ncbi:complex I assembly factor TIMMDC1, mitochondrial [Hemicordylus capensis]|uniref:complex I assembly factor TIMMDC1, mitochondrial n=1 Tax=Hemicordylus capensis TaxID=884348 RepID=UPI0023035D2B|nr:complex I assembly factor TIMMDC1, mitochondrial [Hemicordylus capensis]
MERPAGVSGVRALPGVSGDGSGSASPAVAAAEPGSKTWYVGRPQPPDSGWERLRELFCRDELNRYPEETVYIFKASVTAGIAGFVYGGIPGFIYAKQRYIERSDGEIYHNRMDAAQSAHRAATRGFIRYGWRWSWRIASFVTIFNIASIGLSVYRDKITLGNFVVAGACTGCLFRIHLGLGGLAGGSIFGALLGVPVGGLLMAVQRLAGETLLERRKRERREFYEQKLAEWNTSLSITENISKEINDALQEEPGERDAEKIQN